MYGYTTPLSKHLVAYLEVIKSTDAELHQGKRIDILNANFSVGRNPANSLYLNDPEKIVSRQHASLRYENGLFFFHDAESAYGSYYREIGSPVFKRVPPPIALRAEQAYELRFGLNNFFRFFYTLNSAETSTEESPRPSSVSVPQGSDTDTASVRLEAHLKVVHANAEPELPTCEVKGIEPLLIGRDATASVRFSHSAKISRKNTLIAWDMKRQIYTIKDLNSTHGTSLDNLALIPFQPYDLYPNLAYKIEIGASDSKAVLVFRYSLPQSASENEITED
jgi:pSer/pThr/pTyr-binding forkhead associated (FHA) protein